jgi:hypothetical protein
VAFLAPVGGVDGGPVARREGTGGRGPSDVSDFPEQAGGTVLTPTISVRVVLQ